MKGEKGLLYSLLIILALSSAISAISLRKEYRREEALFQRMEENRSIALSLFNDYVNVDEYRIQSLMYELGLHIEDDKPHVVMLLPPYPCSVCLEAELASFDSFIQSEDIGCIIAGTLQRGKDLHAFSSKYESVTYASYSAESFKDEILMVKIIYVFIMDKSIQKIFVTSKSSLFPSSQFFERVVELIKEKTHN